jgi:hypothetical protein
VHRNIMPLAQQNDARGRNTNAFGYVARGLEDLKILRRRVNLLGLVKCKSKIKCAATLVRT